MPEWTSPFVKKGRIKQWERRKKLQELTDYQRM